MAEKALEGNKKVTYKFGQSDIDLNKYIHNLGTNLLTYMNSKNFNEGLRLEFTQAYDRYLTGLRDLSTNNTNRFYTHDNGSIMDTLGEFSSKDNDNIDPVGSEYYYDDNGNRISTDDFNTLKLKKLKKYNTFSANNEVATYFNWIGNALRDTTSAEPAKTNKFNFKEHGFVSHFNTTYNPTGETVDPSLFWDKDPMDSTTGKRGTINRANFLKDLIGNYITNLGDYDLSGTPFKDKDTFVSTLQNAQEKLANGYNSDAALALNLAGIGGEFLRNFFNTGNSSEAQLPAGMSQEEYDLRKRALDKVKADELEALRTAVEAPTTKEMNEVLASKMRLFELLGISNWNKEARKLPNLSYDSNKLAPSLLKKLLGIANFSKIFEDFDKYQGGGAGSNFGTGVALESPASQLANNLDLYLKLLTNNGIVEGLEEDPVNIDSYIIPESFNADRGIIKSYNPKNRSIYTLPAYKTETGKQTWTEWYNKTLEKHTKPEFSKKDGGILIALNGISLAEFAKLKELERKRKWLKEAESLNTLLKKELATETSSKVQTKEGLRKPYEDFSGTDIARLTAVGLDVASMISAYVPGPGTAVSAATGVGSTLTTLGADIAEDGFLWGDLGNAAIGLGADAVGLIPGWGSAGKVGKIIKQLVRYAPRIMLALLAKNALSPEARVSWSKIGTPSELTVDDWRNIGSGITAFAGVHRMAAGLLKANSMRNATRTGDYTITDKVGKQLKITPELLETIRNTKSLKEANLALLSIKGYEGKELRSLFQHGFWNNISRGWNHLPTVREHYDFSKLRDSQFGKGKNSDASLYQAAKEGKIGKAIPSFDMHLNIKNPYKVKTVKSSSTSLPESVALKPQLLMLPATVSKVETPSAPIITPPPGQYRTTPVGTDVTKHNKLYDARQNQANLDELWSKMFAQRKLDKQIVKKEKATQAGLRKTKVRNQHEEALIRRNNSLAISPNFKAPVTTEITYLTPPISTVPTAPVSMFTDNLTRILLLALFRLARKNASLNNTLPHKQKKPKKLKEEKKGYVNKKEDGGKFSLVRRFKDGKTITNTTSTANWFNDMYSSNPMKLWLGTFNKDNFNDFNNLLKSWSTNLKETLYVPGATPISYNKGVSDRLAAWNKTGTNSVIENLATSGIITRPGMSGDNAGKGFLDGYFGTLEYLRHGGTRESWIGKENELKLLQGELATKGLNYLLDNESGMYLLSLASKPGVTTAKPIGVTTVKGEKKLPESTPQSGVLSGEFNNPTMMYGLPRAVYADSMNRKITDLAKDSITPLLKDPNQIHRITRGDLDAEMQGTKTYAGLRNMASLPISSDANVQQAVLLEAELKGQEAINAGKVQSNQTLRLYDELAWQLEKENAGNRHETAMFNRGKIWETNLDKSKMEQAYLAKKHNIWDVLGQLVEFDARTKQLENKAIERSFTQSDIDTAVTNNLKDYASKAGILLSDTEATIWDAVNSGTRRGSELTPEEALAYQNAAKIAAQIKQDLLSEYLNIGKSRWSGLRNSSNSKTNKSLLLKPIITDAPVKKGAAGGTLLAKDGAKIAVAGILARTKDAERFLKQIKESIDRNEKVLARLSKSLHGIIKSSITK